MAKDLSQLIRERAYQKWESSGRPHGQHHQHWLEAEREILGTDSAPADSFSGDAAGLKAARAYDRDVKKFGDSGRVAAKVKEAKKALDGPEGASLKRAEEAGKRRGRGGT
jgi:hypothetical protein